MILCSSCGLADVTNRKDCSECRAPVVFVPKPKFKRPKPELEQPIKLRIRDALIAEGCWAKIHNVDNRQMSTGLGIGTSDILCIVPPGMALWIEVKRPKLGRVTDEQECFMRGVRAFGCIAGVATSVPEALALLSEARQAINLGASKVST